MVLSPRVAFVTAVLLLAEVQVNGFQVARPPILSRLDESSRIQRAPTALFMSDERPKYSRKIQLREEAESPFRKVRFFFYASLGAGALTSLFISSTRLAAALAGVNVDLLQESAINAAVDIGGLVLIAFLFKRDLDAQDSRLSRASKGAELAALKIRGSKNLLGAQDDDSSTFTTSLSSFRRGRGIEKRVVIVAAGKDKIDQIMKEAGSLQDSLSMNDLVVVPVVLPQAIAPALSDISKMPECVALPVGGNWKVVIDDETKEARKQGVDVETEGISIILKKNGRVGQRTKGVFLDKMVGEVVERRESGMDVKNI